jgi:hypothetical protein
MILKQWYEKVRSKERTISLIGNFIDNLITLFEFVFLYGIIILTRYPVYCCK